jgi:hypothetical protein
MDGPGLESRQGRDFSLVFQKFKLDDGPQQHSYSVGTKCYFPRVMSQESAAESSHQSSAAVMNEWRFYDVDRDNLTNLYLSPILTHSLYKSVTASVLVFNP